MKSITIDGNTAAVKEVSVPKVRPTYLLAKVDSIALNPTVRHIYFSPACTMLRTSRIGNTLPSSLPPKMADPAVILQEPLSKSAQTSSVQISSLAIESLLPAMAAI